MAMHLLGCSNHSFDRVCAANSRLGKCFVMSEAGLKTREYVSKSGQCCWENTCFFPRPHFWAAGTEVVGEPWFASLWGQKERFYKCQCRTEDMIVFLGILFVLFFLFFFCFLVFVLEVFCCSCWRKWNVWRRINGGEVKKS